MWVNQSLAWGGSIRAWIGRLGRGVLVREWGNLREISPDLCNNQ